MGTTSAQRIADLERRVAELTARVEQIAQQALLIGTLEQMRLARQDYAEGRAARSRGVPPAAPPVSRQAARMSGEAVFTEDTHTSPDGCRGTAVLSTDQTRRYLLARRWDDGPLMAWVMLNPSTADARTDDATITRCVRRARNMGGLGGIAVVNLFSLRATDPRALRSCPDPVGAGNDSFIVRTCRAALLVVAAWGAHGDYLDRADAVTSLLARWGIQPYCLGVTASGQARHPGRMAYATALKPFGGSSVDPNP